MTEVNPVDAAIAQAENMAKEQQSTNTIDTVKSGETNAVAQYKAAAPVCFDDLDAEMSVDNFLKFTPDGMKIGDSSLLDGNIKATIDTSADLMPFEGIRFGNPATYYKTYDRAICAKSNQPWGAAVKEAQAADKKAYVYKGVDVTLTLTEDAVSKNEVVAEEGVRIGFSTSPTALKAFKAFKADVERAGLWGQEVSVEVSFEKKKKPGYEWSVPKFTLISKSE